MLTQPNAIKAFETWSNFYTKYKVSKKIDMLTRFRTGEAPIIIAPYTFYNSIVAGAPEIDGLWNFALVPGTQNGDEVTRDVYGTGTGAVIFSNSDDKESSWNFLKWWTSEEAQYQYGIEMESILGPSGRVATANIAALERMPWSKSALGSIMDQMQYANGLPEAPGGYMTSRYISTAVRLVINNGTPAREAILDYSALIDNEITSKRKQFKLD